MTDTINPTYTYKDQTRADLFNMILTLLQTLHNEELDAMTAARYFMKKWKINADWHEYAIALDLLHTNGHATITRPGGNVRYRIH